MAIFKEIKIRKTYKQSTDDSCFYILAINFESKAARDDFLNKEKKALGGSENDDFYAFIPLVCLEQHLTFVAGLKYYYPQEETFLKTPLEIETYEQTLFGFKRLVLPKCLPFSKVNLFDMTDTAFDENNTDCAIAITFQNKAERDAFVARESRINIPFSSELKARIKKDDELVAFIRYGASAFYSKDKHDSMNKKSYKGLIAYFKKMYPDAYDFDKPLETIKWTFNSLDEDLKAQKQAQPAPTQAIAVQAEPTLEELQAKLMTNVYPKMVAIAERYQGHVVKDAIGKAIAGKDLKPCSGANNPFHNPIAKGIMEKQITFSSTEQDIIRECQNSARLVITSENHDILLNYFLERRKSDDKLGNLYKSIPFSSFVLRLFQKRFKEVYYDGRAIVLRDGKSYGNADGSNGKAFLRRIGTPEDVAEIYKEYLTLEESVLSSLVLPQATSIVIGTGNRSEEKSWNVAKELKESIDVATFSYPAAAEFRNGNTAHYDYFFIVKPDQEDETYKQQVALIKNNPALMQVARSLYGDTFAFEIENKADQRFETINADGQIYYLNKNAYLARTKNILKSLLMAADLQMCEQGLGKTFQLKGLGLGAFSFSGQENNEKLQALYIQCLKSVLEDKDFKLKHINCINLINLPSDMKELKAGEVKKENTTSAIKLIRTCMEPTSNLHVAKIGEIGGVVVCGDSGSKFGNEGNIGLDRSSSDDPAAQYSLLDPLILDFEVNPKLQNKDCIHVIADSTLKPLAEPAGVVITPLAPQIPPVSLLGSIQNRLNDFLKAPSKHPITLGFMGAIVAFGAGMSALTIGLVAGVIIGGLKLRQQLHAKALEHRPNKPNPCEPISDAFKADWDGSKAVTWTAYFKSCTEINNWKHPVIFGAAMLDQMDKEEKKARVNQP